MVHIANGRMSYRNLCAGGQNPKPVAHNSCRSQSGCKPQESAMSTKITSRKRKNSDSQEKEQHQHKKMAASVADVILIDSGSDIEDKQVTSSSSKMSRRKAKVKRRKSSQSNDARYHVSEQDPQLIECRSEEYMDIEYSGIVKEVIILFYIIIYLLCVSKIWITR